MVRSHIQPDRCRGAWPPRAVAVPPDGVRRWVPYFRAAALTQRWVVASQNGWLLVVSMTAVRPWARMVRSYRLVSWWTMTTLIVSALVRPVLVLVASTFSPGFSEEMGTAFPLASSTLVAAAKLNPPVTHDSAASLTALPPASSAACAPACSAASMAATSTSPSPPVPTTRATVTAALMQLDSLGLV